MNRTAVQHNSDNRDIMSHVRELCKLMGIRQKDLADSLELKPSQMNLYFQGKVEMRGDRLLDILNILGIDVEAQLKTKLAELGGGGPATAPGTENKILATLGRLHETKRESLLRIIHILGEK